MGASWQLVAPPQLRGTLEPCGMICDFLRVFYTSEVVISLDPLTTARLRWYRAPEGAKVLPTAHAFGAAHVWDSFQRLPPVRDLGEQLAPIRWDAGITPDGVTGQETPTPLEWFRSGVPAEAIADPPVAKCVMAVDLTNNTVTLGPTGIIVGGPGSVTIAPPPPPAVQPPPVVITVPITIGGPLVIGGPLSLPVVAPVVPVDGNAWVIPATCSLHYRCGGATKTVSTLGGPAQLPTTAPANPVDGSMYVDPNDCTLRVWCGGGWKTFSPLTGPVVLPPTEPSSPLLGSCYSDPGNNVCKLWNGSAWLQWTLIGEP